MKNKYLMFAAMAAVMGLSSCDMDKTPYDSLVDTEALQTVTDFKNIRAGIYSGLRSSIGGTFYICPDGCHLFALVHLRRKAWVLCKPTLVVQKVASEHTRKLSVKLQTLP